MKRMIYITGLFLLLISSTCTNQSRQNETSRNWENTLNDNLPLLGHRNWILVVDKAFPLQTGEGIEIVYTGEKLLPVLSHVLSAVESSNHVKPIVYTDKELEFLNDNMVEGIEKYRESLKGILPGQTKSMLHDSVFTKIKKSSELFRVLVLKTDQVMPYTSVFIELGCQYWPAEKEKHLRSEMSEK
jgi:D-ribose pyranose/furanose isomerase RbsD